jgi:hypothetical protein
MIHNHVDIPMLSATFFSLWPTFPDYAFRLSQLSLVAAPRHSHSKISRSQTHKNRQ